MSGRTPRPGFARRPSDPDAWVRAPDPAPKPADAYTARLTIDVTPILRGRIKITAFERGITVAEMLRALLEREYGGGDLGGGGAP
jgi:hypothetical protein